MQAVVGFTDSQVTDLLMLRQLYLSRLGHLQRARRSARDELSKAESAGHLCAVGRHAESLEVIVATIHHTHLQFITACYLGVRFGASHAA